MSSYPHDIQLVAALDRHDELIRRCVAGKISFAEFCVAYDNFYWSFALDGHESDSAGLLVLAQHSARITPHKLVAETILSKVCADVDESMPEYLAAGRFGTGVALALLERIAVELPARGS